MSAHEQQQDTVAAVERVLSSVDTRLRFQHRAAMNSDDVIFVPRNRVTLIYVICGGLRVDSTAHGSLYAAGDALLFTGREQHSLRTENDAFILVSELDFTETAAHLYDLLPGTVSVRDLLGSDPGVAALASQLGPELGRGETPVDQSGSSVICRMMANTVLVAVIRTWALRGCAPRGWPSATSDPFLDRVVAAVRANPGEEWTLESLARESAMSRSVFAERFRSATGTSPASYVANVRIRSAKDLLARGLGISEVSRAIGYGSDDGFSRAFRRHVGTTPSVWRRNAMMAPEREGASEACI